MTKRIEKSEEQWQRELTPEQYRVCRQHGTERAFTGAFYDHHEAGTYTCVGCGEPLFASDAKFESGSGWPSFWAPAADAAVESKEDGSLFMKRTEVLCAACGSHLGHVFPDGPAPTGQRFCINSVSLGFAPKK